MATQTPLRSVRIPALQRQCLFLRHQRLNRPLAAAASRTFSSTPSLARGSGKYQSMRSDGGQARAAIKNDVGPSPKVSMDKMQRGENGMVEDIGILQGTMVRAPMSKLPNITTRAFWGYYWALVKSKGMALYSRSVHRRTMQKKGLSRFLPVDAWGNKALKDRAQNMYKHLYTSFAEGNVGALEKICLPPVLEQFEKRIKSRHEKGIKWKLHEWKSVKVMSHRSAPLGEDQPDTAYRQAVIRLVSLQSVTRKGNDDRTVKVKSKSKASHSKASRRPAWAPEEAREKLRSTSKAPEMETVQKLEPVVHEESVDNSTIKEVEEYLVLQKRVINGGEEDWKIQGFTEESTPEKIQSDEEYWSKQLAVQAQNV
ncbi:hypothetical protein NX059_005275 [Plenodomus lindquistii]|nr:hypothetical protein NX059_005275 [Plenodomus lindquistii]